MKAAVLYENNQPLVLEDVRIDSPKANEVKVKMADDGLPEYVRFKRKPVKAKCNIYSG